MMMVMMMMMMMMMMHNQQKIYCPQLLALAVPPTVIEKELEFDGFSSGQTPAILDKLKKTMTQHA
eukprot:10005942-Karenia_brevis.AAC.1